MCLQCKYIVETVENALAFVMFVSISNGNYVLFEGRCTWSCINELVNIVNNVIIIIIIIIVITIITIIIIKVTV